MNKSSPESLIRFQHAFMAAVHHREQMQNLEPNIYSIGKLKTDEVISLYRDDYVFRLTQALGETYEACWCLLGDDEFFRLASLYIKKNPSHFYNLTNYGKEFSQFLQMECAETHLILEMAQFELHFWDLFHTFVEDQQELKFLLNKFSSLELAMQQKWQFHSSIYFFNSQWRLWDIFCQRKEGLGNCELDDFHESQSGILYRHGPVVKAAILPLEQWQLLKMMREGATPLQLLNSTPTATPQMIQELFAFLSNLPLVASV